MEIWEPIPPFNTRYPDKLESILGSVKQTFGDEYLNPTVLDAASSYFNQFIRGHAFLNGNKRCGVLFTHVFILLNDVDFTLTSNEMYNFAIAIAKAGELGYSAEETKTLTMSIFRRYTKDSVWSY